MYAFEPITDTEIDEPEPDWQSLAACNDGAGTLVEVFFSEQLDDIAAAKAICAVCPVQEACLDGALRRREPWGVWGGELFLNGKILAHKRKRGRPPKVRPPEEIAAFPKAFAHLADEDATLSA